MPISRHFLLPTRSRGYWRSGAHSWLMRVSVNRRRAPWPRGSRSPSLSPSSPFHTFPEAIHPRIMTDTCIRVLLHPDIGGSRAVREWMCV
ncbi:hypothetical protein BD626DRAFT_261851 [Schizophyllum amplum]|uniref:Uncharacterized protein n=1 Tax=Schizophyllum amplum TaxID=97359 RepID=A0A550CGC7_9AGAR|nr:hypothetical protein BD626DRAFT_261851 [Auriculariopsis ampla]